MMGSPETWIKRVDVARSSECSNLVGQKKKKNLQWGTAASPNLDVVEGLPVASFVEAEGNPT